MASKCIMTTDDINKLTYVRATNFHFPHSSDYIESRWNINTKIPLHSFKVLVGWRTHNELPRNHIEIYWLKYHDFPLETTTYSKSHQPYEAIDIAEMLKRISEAK